MFFVKREVKESTTMSSNLDMSMACIKYMLIISNFMFLMVGFMLVSVGSTIQTIYNNFDPFLEATAYNVTGLVIVIGVLVFFISFFGFLGAVRQRVCMINLYAFFLALVLLLEIGTIIVAYNMRNNVATYIHRNMNNAMSQYNSNIYAKDSWDFLQTRIGCCGIYSPADWQPYISEPVLTQNGTMFIPQSCCWYGSVYYSYAYTRGCIHQLYSTITGSFRFIIGGILCVALIQILGIIFARLLANALRSLKTAEEMKRQENRRRIYEELALEKDEKKVTPVLYIPQSSEC